MGQTSQSSCQPVATKNNRVVRANSANELAQFGCPPLRPLAAVGCILSYPSTLFVGWLARKNIIISDDDHYYYGGRCKVGLHQFATIARVRISPSISISLARLAKKFSSHRLALSVRVVAISLRTIKNKPVESKRDHNSDSTSPGQLWPLCQAAIARSRIAASQPASQAARQTSDERLAKLALKQKQQQ